MCIEGSGKRRRGDVPCMIVGEAPGAYEDAAGTPFVGRAGRILDKGLERAFKMPHARRHVFVTNAVKCRPPKNRDPKPRELRACVSAYLTREIELHDPFAILAVGNVAATALLGRSGIAALRETWHRLDSDAERWVLVTYHPAYIDRQGLDSEAAELWRNDLREFAVTARKGRMP